MYSSKSVKITGKIEHIESSFKHVEKYDIDAKAGWNKIYIYVKTIDEFYGIENDVILSSNSDILTLDLKDFKWILKKQED